MSAAPMHPRSFAGSSNPRNNIMLMTDGYKFSHHKQFPVSWVPEHARPKDGSDPPVLFPAQGSAQGSKIEKLARVPGDGELKKITVITNISTAVVAVESAGSDSPDITYTGTPVVYTGAAKSTVVLGLSAEVRDKLGLPSDWTTVKFANVDESKLKRGSPLNANFEGGYNVSYFTPRAYKDKFDGLATEGGGDHVVFFGLQYLVREYMTGTVVTAELIEEAEAFIARYMADVRVLGPNGFDYTMFPRGDWTAMATGDYDGTGNPDPSRAGVLPIKIESLPEGSLLTPGVCCFKLTNTHPRFYWLPNFLETILVQVWYPMTVATQTREFRKTIQAYSFLSERHSQIPEVAGLGPSEFTIDNIVDDKLAVHIAQVFDLLDFGYRGVSSHETAALGSASYYVAGFEGSDTVAGSRMALWVYDGFKPVFEDGHGATSIPAAEHSTITSWADMAPDSDPAQYEKDEYCAFANMVKQYMPAFGVSLVSDGFNIWNAVCNHWTSDANPDAAGGGVSMRAMLKERLEKGQLSLIRPDSGEGVETLPQLLTLMNEGLPEHWVTAADLPPLAEKFPAGDPRAAAYKTVVDKIRAKTGISGNPFRRFTGQQMRVLQGDGIALDTVGDMLASILANGFCANTVHFGSGGGLLQKINRDSLSCAFKCCAMYVGDKAYVIGKDPIAGGKKSYPGNPAVIRGADGILRNRGEYDASGKMTRSTPITTAEFKSEAGAEGDELKLVFLNGELKSEVNEWMQIRERAKVTAKHLDAAVTKALENLGEKTEFLQRMSSPKAIAVRLAEASTGAKWMHNRSSKLGQMKENFPKYAAEFDALGLTEAMDTAALTAHIKSNLCCDKKAAKRVLAALADGDMEEASAKMGDKVALTL